MKKILSFVFLLVSAFILVGCNKTTEAPTTTKAPTTTEAPKSTTEAPGTTTETPASTTEAPGTTTKAPGTTTKEPTTTEGGNTTASSVEAFDLGGKIIRIATKRASSLDYDYSNALDPTKIRENDENEAYWSVVEKTQKYIESKYNCHIQWVDLTTISEQTVWTHYQNVYAAGDMYDIIEITGEEFPYLYMNDMLQELPEDYLDSDVADLFWGGEDGFQYTAFTHLDKKWGVGATNSIFEDDKNYKANAFAPLLYYNIDLLEEAGIEKMPSEYWQEGTWSWEVFEDMCLQVVNNLPGVQGLADHSYSGGIQNFLGSNGTFVFDDYGNMGFYSEPAQAVYTQWNKWTDSKVIYNYTYAGELGAPTSYFDQRWFRDGAVAFSNGLFSHIIGYFPENISCVPYPYGPNATGSDGKIDLDSYHFNWYNTGFFWSVPKNKDLRLYQILAEFYGGLKEYYTDADDLEATIDNFVVEKFQMSEWDYINELFLYIQENMSFSIIQSAVPSGIFRQAIREHYTKGSAFYGEMWAYMQSRQSEVSPENPNNFWLCIFGEPGNLPQS